MRKLLIIVAVLLFGFMAQATDWKSIINDEYAKNLQYNVKSISFTGAYGYGNLKGTDVDSVIAYIADKYPDLEKLTLTGNGWDHIPMVIADLDKVTLLDLSSNPIVSIPAGTISGMASLEACMIANAKLANADDVFLSRSVSSVNLHNNKLETFKVEAYESLVISLTLSKNKFESLPKDVAKFKRMAFLDVSDNKLTNIDAMKSMTLSDLNISNNEFSELPDVLWTLTSLNELDIQNNGVKKIPDGILKLEYLNHKKFYYTGGNCIIASNGTSSAVFEKINPPVKLFKPAHPPKIQREIDKKAKKEAKDSKKS